MKTIIAGSRGITDYKLICEAITKSGFTITEIVSGAARGVDRLGEEYGRKRNIRIKLFPAKWDVYGKSAGYRRNEDMAAYAETLIAIWDGESKGTKHMIDMAKKQGLYVYVHKA